MSSTPQQLLNPLTSSPYEGIRDMERVVAGLADCYVDNPDFHFVEDLKLRPHQLGALNRGFGYLALTPVTENTTPNHETEQAGPMIHVLTVTENPAGETWDNVLRLTEQGQATLADGSTSSLDTFARLHGTWRPSSLAERNTALLGLREKLAKPASLSINATEEILKNAEKWAEEARNEQQALELAESQAEMSMSERASLIRANEATISAIINIRLSARIFETGKTVQKDRTPYNKLANEVRNEVVSLDDGQLVYMWDTAFEAARSRRMFWEGQITDAQSDPRVEMVKRDRLQRARQ